MNDEHREHPLPWAADGAIGDAGGHDAGEHDSGAQGAAPADDDGPGAGAHAPAPTPKPAGPLDSGVVAALARRPDPRLRPPDPAGTQPKHDPATLISRRHEDAVLLGHATELRAGETDVLDDADGVGAHDLLPVPRDDGGIDASPATPATEVPYASHFNLIRGILGAVAGAAVVAIVVALTHSSRPSSARGPNWSAWKPVNNYVDPAVQIAAHVAPEYKLNDGRQLVTVRGGPPSYQGQPLALALLQSGEDASLLGGNAVLYRLCGTGPNCAIRGGTPSVARALLLRREGLELALYTFHYLSGADQVVVIIPPLPTTLTDKSGQLITKSAGPSRALFFRPATVASALSQTLNRTLPRPTPDVAGMNDSRNASLVADVTSPAIYDYSIIQQSDSYVLVLTPPSIGG